MRVFGALQQKSMKRSESPEPLPVNHESGDEAKSRRKKRTQRAKMEVVCAGCVVCGGDGCRGYGCGGDG